MVSIPGSKARHRSRKTPTPKQAFAGPPGSSRSSAAGTVIHPPSGPARSPSRMVFNASMLLLMVGASEMCACTSAFAGTTTERLSPRRDFDLHQLARPRKSLDELDLGIIEHDRHRLGNAGQKHFRVVVLVQEEGDADDAAPVAAGFRKEPAGARQDVLVLLLEGGVLLASHAG